MVNSAFQSGECLQRGLCDLAPALLTPSAYTPRSLIRTALFIARQWAELLAAFTPAFGVRSSLREFRSKIEVFDLFENVDTVLRLPNGTRRSLRDLVARANALDPFTAVWAIEGIGHYYAETVWESRGAPHGLLREVAARDLPAKSLVALHAGMGLSLANRLLARVGRACRKCPESSHLDGVLRQFVSLCRDNSSEAYVAASYEALGLVARNLYPHLVTDIDRELPTMGDNLSDYFWHGVGRAIYFAPTNYLPLSGVASRVVEMTQQEPPHEPGRRNALAGAIWAMVLVNLREPEVVENFLGNCADVRFDRDAFANGVSSATVIWRDSTESTAQLEALCRYRSQLGETWRTLIHDPCRIALDHYYAALRRHNCIGEVFRYQSLPRLLEKLDLDMPKMSPRVVNAEGVGYSSPGVINAEGVG